MKPIYRAFITIIGGFAIGASIPALINIGREPLFPFQRWGELGIVLVLYVLWQTRRARHADQP